MYALNFIFAFVAVLALIALVFWLVRRFAGSRIGAQPNRGRMPRLAVIDAAAVDGRRRLVLIRRDNVEHLLMIGGPTDIVVETNIVRATTARDQIAQRQSGAEPQQPRIAPLPDAGNWSDGDGTRTDGFDHPEPQMPELPPRPARPSFAEELRRPAPVERRSAERGDPLTGLTPEPLGGGRSEPLSSRLEPLAGRPEPRPELRGEPMPSRVTSRNDPVMPRAPRQTEAPNEPLMPRMPRQTEAAKPPLRATERTAAPPPPPPVNSAADQNLAEMAQRLEAALRRPAAEAPEPRIGAPPVAPEPPPVRSAPRGEPPPPAAAPKTGFENLEDEMASLLGRPKPSS
jgi:flagellar biogenesis protein FliO